MCEVSRAWERLEATNAVAESFSFARTVEAGLAWLRTPAQQWPVEGWWCERSIQRKRSVLPIPKRSLAPV